MQTIKKIYKIKRDMSDTIDIIQAESKDDTKNIQAEKIISTILHKIIIKKEDDFKNEK